MDLSMVLLLILIALSRKIAGKSECMQVVGTLVCPRRPVLAGNVQIDLKDADLLPWEMDDQMGRTWSQSNGSFILSGCGADFGPFNLPDPYITIEHKCPSVLRSLLEKDTTARVMQFALTKTFMPKILNVGKVFLDDSDA